jgi:hypothetical protein
MAMVQSLGAAPRLGWNGGAGGTRAKSVETLAPGLWAMLTIAEVVSVGAAPARDFAFEDRVEQGAPLPVELTQAASTLARVLRVARGGTPLLCTERGTTSPEPMLTRFMTGRKALARPCWASGLEGALRWKASVMKPASE